MERQAFSFHLPLSIVFPPTLHGLPPKVLRLAIRTLCSFLMIAQVTVVIYILRLSRGIVRAKSRLGVIQPPIPITPVIDQLLTRH